MPAVFPNAVRVYTSKTDLVDTVLAEHVNLLQDEVTAVQSALGTGMLASSWSGTFATPSTHTSVSARLANMEAGLLTRSPSASPTFTGTVTLPSGTSIGSVTSTEIGYLSGVSSSIQTQLGTKAPLASPALSGTPTAPTAPVSTNTTQVATTAFVVGQVANDAPSKTGSGATGTWGISVTGNAATATKLATARTIALSGDVTGSTSFDGSGNATITAEQKTPGFVSAFLMAGL